MSSLRGVEEDVAEDLSINDILEVRTEDGDLVGGLIIDSIRNDHEYAGAKIEGTSLVREDIDV